MLYLNYVRKQEDCKTILNLTLTNVVFEYPPCSYLVLQPQNLTLTNVVFESLFYHINTCIHVYLTLTNVVFEFPHGKNVNVPT